MNDDLMQGKRILFWSVAPKLIAYRRQPNAVEILFVERAERNWQDLLRSMP